MAIIATMKDSPVRRLKVYEKILIYHEGYLNSTLSRFPEIRLMGKWLKDSGFLPGDTIQVLVEANKLVITNDRGMEEGPVVRLE
ncbi:SymE family type I addiction module toxin [Niabella hirudinis]|uniref:SymE family type I addiction module toxin n=1 Tax=Niabella hirudinis TaxID=1285929 RepID=UPI003EC063E2